MRFLLSLLIIGALLAGLPVVLHAEEPTEPTAVEIAELLLSTNEVERTRGETLLLAQLARDEDQRAFLRTLSGAVGRWANREERLIEVWVAQAIEGTTAERDRAVRLLTALGEPAVRRLVLELRHARHHEGAAGLPQQSAALCDELPLEQQGEAHPPRIYDARPLIGQGLNPVQVVDFLRKAADASEVVRYDTRCVVYATEGGHAALEKALGQLATQQGKARDAETTPPEAKPPGPTPVPEPNAPGQAEGALAPEPVTAPVSGPGPAWTIESLVVRVPAEEAQAAFRSLFEAEQGGAGKNHVRVGDVKDAEPWAETARKLTDAKAERAEPVRAVAGRSANAFVGQTKQYRRSVQPTKGGAWQVGQGTLRTGLDFRFDLTTEADTLGIRMTARLSEVAQPMGTIKVRPEKASEPIELDDPEWNVASCTVDFVLPQAGGATLLVLEDLGVAANELVVVVLKVTPAADAAKARPQQVRREGK